MYTFGFILVCIQACLIQNVHSLCGCGNRGLGGGYGTNLGPGLGANGLGAGLVGGYGNLVGLGGGYGNNLGAGFGAAGLGGGAYGGIGEGELVAIGELAVQGLTNVGGQVPVTGAVHFGGNVPAAGSVSIAGSCACGCGYGGGAGVGYNYY